MLKRLIVPANEKDISELQVGDKVLVSGTIYCGRDAVLPRIANLAENDGLKEKGIDLRGSVIFHTAVSVAGVGPTSSNKYEIESNIPALSKAGVKIHLGKGELTQKTIEELNRYNSVYAVMPPVTALLESRTISRKVIAFPEEGMEAFHELKVIDYPVIIAAAHGKSIYDK